MYTFCGNSAMIGLLLFTYIVHLPQLNTFVCAVGHCMCSMKRNVCWSSRQCVIEVVSQDHFLSLVDWCLPVMRAVVTCMNVAVKSWTDLSSWQCEIQLCYSLTAAAIIIITITTIIIIIIITKFVKCTNSSKLELEVLVSQGRRRGWL